MTKHFIKRTVISFCVLPCLATAEVSLDDIDVSTLPHQFANGQVADANQVNANFEYLRQSIDSLVAYLKQPVPPIWVRGFGSAQYNVVGIENNLEACESSSHIQNDRVTGSSIVSGSVMSLSTSTARNDLRIGGGSGPALTSSSRVDTSSLNIGNDGSLFSDDGNVVGSFASDGNSFVLVYKGTESEGCSKNWVGYMTGTRVTN